MEEKYRLCDDSLSQLLAWIAEMEDRLANQDVAQEDIEQLRNQINILKVTHSPSTTNIFNRYISPNSKEPFTLLTDCLKGVIF